MQAKSREVDGEKLSRNTKRLKELPVGTEVAIQNQKGMHPTKCDKTRLIVENRLILTHQVITVPGNLELTDQPGDRCTNRVSQQRAQRMVSAWQSHI